MKRKRRIRVVRYEKGGGEVTIDRKKFVFPRPESHSEARQKQQPKLSDEEKDIIARRIHKQFEQDEQPKPSPIATPEEPGYLELQRLRRENERLRFEKGQQRRESVMSKNSKSPSFEIHRVKQPGRKGRGGSGTAGSPPPTTDEIQQYASSLSKTPKSGRKK